MRGAFLGVAALLLAGCGGQTVSLQVDDARYRAPLIDGGAGVAYFTVTSNVADRIVAVSSPGAASVEVHASGESRGMASMHKVESVELPAGQPVTFGPGGLHLMVFSPGPVAADATFPIQITLESGRTETIGFSPVENGSPGER